MAQTPLEREILHHHRRQRQLRTWVRLLDTSSMRPFLFGEAFAQVQWSYSLPIHTGDLIYFRIPEGFCVLHRAILVGDDEVFQMGDAYCPGREGFVSWVPRESILGVVRLLRWGTTLEPARWNDLTTPAATRIQRRVALINLLAWRLSMTAEARAMFDRHRLTTPWRRRAYRAFDRLRWHQIQRAGQQLRAYALFEQEVDDALSHQLRSTDRHYGHAERLSGAGR